MGFRPSRHVLAWAFEGDAEPSALYSNTFIGSFGADTGREVPEMDRCLLPIA